MAATQTPSAPSLTCLHVEFLLLLPRLQLHGRIHFRHLKCQHRREEAIAEMVGLAWKWYRRLVERGKDPMQFPTALASYAAKAVRCGRRVAGVEAAKDALSSLAQQRHGFSVSPLPQTSGLEGNAFDDALADNTQTPPDEQAAFRLDFPEWLTTRCERDRRLLHDLMLGERTLDVSRKYGLCPARVSQLRREFKEDWDRFCGEAAV